MCSRTPSWGPRIQNSSPSRAVKIQTPSLGKEVLCSLLGTSKYNVEGRSSSCSYFIHISPSSPQIQTARCHLLAKWDASGLVLTQPYFPVDLRSDKVVPMLCSAHRSGVRNTEVVGTKIMGIKSFPSHCYGCLHDFWWLMVSGNTDTQDTKGRHLIVINWGVQQSLAGKNISTEVEGIVEIRHQETSGEDTTDRGLSTCCSELIFVIPLHLQSVLVHSANCVNNA
jgi:hypothetical protein